MINEFFNDVPGALFTGAVVVILSVYFIYYACAEVIKEYRLGWSASFCGGGMPFSEVLRAAAKGVEKPALVTLGGLIGALLANLVQDCTMDARYGCDSTPFWVTFGALVLLVGIIYPILYGLSRLFGWKPRNKIHSARG